MNYLSSLQTPDTELIPVKYIGDLARLYEDNTTEEQKNLAKTITLKFKALEDESVSPF